MGDGAIPPKAGDSGPNLLERLADSAASIGTAYANAEIAKSAIKKYTPSTTTLLIGGGVAVAVVVLLIVVLKK